MKRERPPPPSRWGPLVLKIDDMMMSILIWLPARHLLRLRLVDQRWRSLTSDPNFLRLHTRHHCIHQTSESCFFIYTASQFFYFNPTTTDLLPCELFQSTPFTRILQSSHGLMLVECRDSQYGPKYYRVANPTTGKSRKLSIEKDPAQKNEIIVPLFLDFDPSKSEYYKVGFLRIVSGNHTLDVYDSETNDLNQPRVPDKFHIPPEIYADHRRRVCFKNRVHSIGAYGTTDYMDLEDWSFGTIEIPPHLYDRPNYVVEWNGNLYYMCMYLRTRRHSMVVHRLKEGSLDWSEIRRVGLNPIQTAWPHEMNGDINVLGIVGERDKDRSILLNGGEKIVAYRFGDGSFKLLFDSRRDMEGRQRLFLFGHEVHQVKETFALL